MYRVVGPKHKIVREFRTPFPPRYNRKNPRSVYVRVRRVMARRALCTIRSHGTKSHMLVSKLRSGTSKTKADPGELVRVVLFWKSHCATCSPAYVILNHVTGSCKEPICSKNRKIVPYHRGSRHAENSARLRSNYKIFGSG